MVKKETCAACKGNKVVRVEKPEGNSDYRECPHCNGNGYKVRVVHLMR